MIISIKSENQSGLVSIAVALVMMTIISLMIFSFALVSRREQRLALDRRLSAQAYYAAESGVNTTRKQIENGSLTGNVTTCSPVDIGDSSVQTTCVLVDQTPGVVRYDGVAVDVAKVTRLSTVNSSGVATPLSRLEIFWNATGANVNAFSNKNNGEFPKEFPSGTNPFSVLNISLTKAPTNAFGRDWLNVNTFHAFLYPKDNGAGSDQSVVFGDDKSQGLVVEGNCKLANSPKKCKAVLKMDTDQGSTFFLKLASIYTSADVEIRAFDASGIQLNFQGAQAVIDATGKAQDVLRRVQAVVPLASSWSADNFGIRSNSGICKQYEVASSGVTSPANCGFN